MSNKLSRGAEAPGGGGSQTLQQVLDTGNTSTTKAVFNTANDSFAIKINSADGSLPKIDMGNGIGDAGFIQLYDNAGNVVTSIENGVVTSTSFSGSGASLTGVLLLGQTIPQHIINGAPIFDSGLEIGTTGSLGVSGTANAVINSDGSASFSNGATLIDSSGSVTATSATFGGGAIGISTDWTNQMIFNTDQGPIYFGDFAVPGLGVAGFSVPGITLMGVNTVYGKMWIGPGSNGGDFSVFQRNTLINYGVQVAYGQMEFGLSGRQGIDGNAMAVIDPDTGIAIFDNGAVKTDGSGNLTASGSIKGGGFNSSDGSAGITGTFTTASLVGKTVTFKNGLITGFA
jgi:hypothetical protein